MVSPFRERIALQYRTLSPAQVRPGDRIRRFGESLTVILVTPVTDHGTFEVVFQNGQVARLATISVIDEERAGGSNDPDYRTRGNEVKAKS